MKIILILLLISACSSHKKEEIVTIVDTHSEFMIKEVQISEPSHQDDPTDFNFQSDTNHYLLYLDPQEIKLLTVINADSKVGTVVKLLYKQEGDQTIFQGISRNNKTNYITLSNNERFKIYTRDLKEEKKREDEENKEHAGFLSFSFAHDIQEIQRQIKSLQNLSSNVLNNPARKEIYAFQIKLLNDQIVSLEKASKEAKEFYKQRYKE